MSNSENNQQIDVELNDDENCEDIDEEYDHGSEWNKCIRKLTKHLYFKLINIRNYINYTIIEICELI